MRIYNYAITVALLYAAAVARADTIYNFTINGAGNQNTTQNFVVNGSTMIDTTSGMVKSISFTANGIFFSGVDSQMGPQVYVGGTPGNTSTEALFSFDAASLMDYNTLSDSAFDLRTPDGTDYVGHLSQGAQFTATPEPSTVALLGTGLLGIAGVVRKRFA